MNRKPAKTTAADYVETMIAMKAQIDGARACGKLDRVDQLYLTRDAYAEQFEAEFPREFAAYMAD